MLSKSLTRRTHLHLFVDVILILSSRFIFLSISFCTTDIQESKFKTIWRHFFYTILLNSKLDEAVLISSINFSWFAEQLEGKLMTDIQMHLPNSWQNRQRSPNLILLSFALTVVFFRRSSIYLEIWKGIWTSVSPFADETKSHLDYIKMFLGWWFIISNKIIRTNTPFCVNI